MDFEYEGAEDDGGRILWGRIAIFGGALILALLLGRCTAGGGVSEAEHTELQQENETLTAANEQLQESLTALQGQLASEQAAPGDTGGTGDSTESPAEATSGATGPSGPAPGSTYIVQAGDTLTTIAEQVYGDGQQFGIIAEANGITSSNPLQIGQELQIPPNPDA